MRKQPIFVANRGERGKNVAKKFGATLTNAQIALARKIEAAGLTTYSQAVKAMERKETDRVDMWKAQLAEQEAAKG